MTTQIDALNAAINVMVIQKSNNIAQKDNQKTLLDAQTTMSNLQIDVRIEDARAQIDKLSASSNASVQS